MNKRILIAPSLLSADFLNLGGEIKKCEDGGADIIHVDVMDGCFVPNITIGPQIVKAIRAVTPIPISAHLMIMNPNRYINEFAEAGAEYISVHVEGAFHLHRTLALIQSLGVQAGVTLNPATPLEYAFSAAEYCNYILLMSVDPGFGGQKFIPTFLKRAELLKEFLIKNNLEHIDIEVDGGVKFDNVESIIKAGANILVCGSELFNGNLAENIKKLRNSIDNSIEQTTIV